MGEGTSLLLVLLRISILSLLYFFITKINSLRYQHDTIMLRESTPRYETLIQYDCTHILPFLTYDAYILHARSNAKKRSMADHTWNTLQTLVEKVLTKNIPGAFIETGTWKGGTSLFTKALIQADACFKHNGTALRRDIYLADSWEGFGMDLKHNDDVLVDGPDLTEFHNGGVFDYDLKGTIQFFENNHLKDDMVHFVKGYFNETLHNIEEELWAHIRLDGDLYDSTVDAIGVLYPKLMSEGNVIIDDYNWCPNPIHLDVCPCKRAIDEYRIKFDIIEQMKSCGNKYCEYWIKA